MVTTIEEKTGMRTGNALAFLIMIAVNVMANALPLNGLNTGEVSNLYPSLFTPAGITFSIWSLIYVLLAGFVIYVWRNPTRPYTQTISPWFIASCLLNASWILAWHFLMPLLSVFIMVIFLIVLIRIFLLLQANESVSRGEYIFVHLPFVIYLAWICVATIANISAYLRNIQWTGEPIPEFVWTIIMMAVATLISLIIVRRFKAIAFPLVMVWALTGIALKGLPTITQAAIIFSIVMIAACAITFIQERKNL